MKRYDLINNTCFQLKSEKAWRPKRCSLVGYGNPRPTRRLVTWSETIEVDHLFGASIRKWTFEVNILDHGNLFISEINGIVNGKQIHYEFEDPTPVQELGALIQSAANNG